MITFTESDVSLSLAIRAHNGTSFNPERRGQQYVDFYMQHMAEVCKEFEGYATDENRDEIANALNEYRAGYLKRLNAMLHAKSRCISSFITGPSNFPVRRAEKANDIEHNRTGEYLEYMDWKLAKLRRQFNPRNLTNAPIRLDDDEVIEKLEKKIAKLRRNHEGMKATNKIVRNKKSSKEEKIEALINELGFTEEQAFNALDEDCMGVIGFATFSLTNSNANIKRLEGRLTQAMREQAREQADLYNAPDGIEVVENTEETRIQIIFPGKPSAEVRAVLKQNGFRWSPTQGAWQRLLNANGRSAAKYVISKIGGL